MQNLTTQYPAASAAVLLIIAYIFIALEKIPKVTVALIGASLAIIFGMVSQDKAVDNLPNPLYYVNYIDFNVVFLLISMMIIVSITSRSGIFSYAAVKIVRVTKGNPLKILVSLCFFTAAVSAFLDNVTTVILLMPITFSICKSLNLKPMPFLIGEIFSSNIGGTATLIGDPPNIIIGSAANFSFLDFINELIPIVIVIQICITAFIALVFKKDLKTTAECKVKLATPKINKLLAARSLGVLLLVIMGFMLRDFIHIETSIVALLGAAVLLIFENPQNVWKDVEWNTIFFFIGLFIIIGALEASGGIKIMAQWLINSTKGSELTASMLILWGSGIISGIIDNIPYTATMSPMIAEISKVLGASYAKPLWWCLSLGACLGGNMTIIGAAANVIVSENATKYGFPIGFLKFMGFGIITVFISLALSSGYIYIRFFI